MINFKKLTELIQNVLPNTNVVHDMSYSEYDRIISVKVKDAKLNLTSDSISDADLAEEADIVLKTLKQYYKRWFNVNNNLLFDIYFEDDNTVKIFLPRIIMNPQAFLRTLRSIS